MTPEETLQARLRIATATAAAAVTVAVGVTFASISGYFPGASPAEEAAPAARAEPPSASAPKIVLVPVQPAVQSRAPVGDFVAIADEPRGEWAYADARSEDDARRDDDDRHGDDDAWRGDDRHGEDDDAEEGDEVRGSRRGREREEHGDDD